MHDIDRLFLSVMTDDDIFNDSLCHPTIPPSHRRLSSFQVLRKNIGEKKSYGGKDKEGGGAIWMGLNNDIVFFFYSSDQRQTRQRNTYRAKK